MAYTFKCPFCDSVLNTENGVLPKFCSVCGAKLTDEESETVENTVAQETISEQVTIDSTQNSISPETAQNNVSEPSTASTDTESHPQPPVNSEGNQVPPAQGGHKPTHEGKPGDGNGQPPKPSSDNNTVQQPTPLQSSGVQTNSQATSSGKQVSTLMKALIVLIPTIGPIAGIVLYFMNKSKNTQIANTYFKFAMIGIAVQLIFYGGSRF